MDRRVVSSFLAILLLAVIGHVDADGIIHYFNVSSTMVRKGDSIVFHCGASMDQSGSQDTGSLHSLLIDIRKFIGGPRNKLLSVNEQLEVDPGRFEAKLLQQTANLKEVEFTILNAHPGDSGRYVCETDKTGMSVVINVIAEPHSAVLSVGSEEVGRMMLSTEDGYKANMTGEQFTVQLNQTYEIRCVVKGGNPQSNIVLSSGDQVFENVVTTNTTERNLDDFFSKPMHTMEATLHWTPKVINIARPFVCSAGVENPKAVWANFVPIVSERQPLFSCADKVELKGGVNDLMVTCRIVSVHSSLISLKVNVPRKNITIFVSIDEDFQSGEFSSAQDRRFEVKVVEESIYAWDVTMTVKNARAVGGLDGQKFEFLAENAFDTSAHVVDVEAASGQDSFQSTPKSTPGASSGVTVSMVTILFAMVLGLCLP